MTIKKILGAAAGVVALVASAVSASSSATAAPNWDMWNVSTNTALAPSTVTASGAFTLDFVLNGFPFRLECRVPTLFSKALTSTDVAPIAPGATRSITFTPPAVFSTSTPGPEEGVCQDVTAGPYGGHFTIPFDVTTQNGAWTLNLTAPTQGVSGVFAGSMTANLVLPENAILLDDPSLGCKGEGPLGTNPGDPTTVIGNYNAGSNKWTATSEQTFGVTSPNFSCTIEDIALVNTDVSLDPWISLKF